MKFTNLELSMCSAVTVVICYIVSPAHGCNGVGHPKPVPTLATNNAVADVPPVETGVPTTALIVREDMSCLDEVVPRNGSPALAESVCPDEKKPCNGIPALAETVCLDDENPCDGATAPEATATVDKSTPCTRSSPPTEGPFQPVFLAQKQFMMQLIPFASCHFGNTDTCSDADWYHRAMGFVWVGRLEAMAEEEEAAAAKAAKGAAKGVTVVAAEGVAGAVDGIRNGEKKAEKEAETI